MLLPQINKQKQNFQNYYSFSPSVRATSLLTEDLENNPASQVVGIWEDNALS